MIARFSRLNEATKNELKMERKEKVRYSDLDQLKQEVLSI